MGKGRALLLLSGVAGLLLAVPRLKEFRGRVPNGKGADESEDYSGGSEVLAAPSKSAPRRQGIDSSPAAVVTGLESARNPEQQQTLDHLLPDLIQRDPVAASHLAMGLAAWERREEALLKVADGWAMRDPRAAAGWAAALEDETERIICLSAACERASRADPALALSLASNSPGFASSELVCGLAGNWMAVDRGAAEKWLAEIKDSHLRDRIWVEAARNIGTRAPADAALLAVEKISPGRLQEEAVISALHQWGMRDHEAAVAWVELFPEGPLRERAEGELFGTR